MNTDPAYARFRQSKLILRDELAIDRTLLANERTLLAYLRSGLAMVIAGATMMHFAEAGWFRLLGLGCMPLGVIFASVGVVRFNRVQREIMAVRRQADRAGGLQVVAGGDPD
jgi:putative membrane protein